MCRFPTYAQGGNEMVNWEIIEQTGFSDGYMTGNYPLDIPGYPWWKIFWAW